MLVCIAVSGYYSHYITQLQSAGVSSEVISFNPQTGSEPLQIGEIGGIFELEVIALIALWLTFFRQVTDWTRDGSFPSASSLKVTNAVGVLLNVILIVALFQLTFLLYSPLFIFFAIYFILVTPAAWKLSEHVIRSLWGAKK